MGIESLNLLVKIIVTQDNDDLNHNLISMYLLFKI